MKNKHKVKEGEGIAKRKASASSDSMAAKMIRALAPKNFLHATRIN